MKYPLILTLFCASLVDMLSVVCSGQSENLTARYPPTVVASSRQNRAIDKHCTGQDCNTLVITNSALNLAADVSNPFVHNEGQQLRDGQGKDIELRGMNLGGWLIWEGWIWEGGFNSESTIIEGLEALLSTAETEIFRQQIYHNFITEADIARISALGFNVVRIPITHRLLK